MAFSASDPAPVVVVSPDPGLWPAPSGPGTAAFDAWFAGSRIVADGAPLICYHGTTADFSVFAAHAPVTVHRLDGAEIERLDSFDVEGDWTRRPGGFHYGALTDAVQLGAEAALAMREREADRLAAYRGEPRTNDPADDTVRRLTDLRRLIGRSLTRTTEVRPSGDGHYFTPDVGYSFIRDIGLHDAGRVMPVYLAIRHPVYLNAAQIESAGSAHWVAHYRALGHDGAIFSDYADLRRRGWSGATQIVAFDAHQIKSVFNVGTYDPANPDIRFRRDDAQRLPVPAAAPALPAPLSPTQFTLPPAIGAGALARHGLGHGVGPVAVSPAAPTQREAAFAAWFGDSHVRHPDGTPRICYHGTTADVTVFRAAGGTAADPGWYGSGIYLSADPASASAYAGDLGGEGAGQDGRAPRVIAAYVALQHPYVWPAGRAAATTVEEAQAIRAELEAAGYDGVVVPNPYAEPEVADHWEVVAFHPTQVKSAYNVGTFDPANADIRFARAQPALAPAPAVPDSAAFRDWFGESVIRDARGAPLMVFHGSRAAFDDFALDKAMSAGRAASEYGRAIYFTADPDAAAGYAASALQGGAEVLYPVYLSMRKPYVIDLTKVAVRGVYAPGHDPAFVARLQARGYDGIIVVDEDVDGLAPTEPLRDLPGFATEIVVFDAAQIRSAIADDKDLSHPAHVKRMASLPTKPGPVAGAAFDAWFGQSKAVDAQGRPLTLYHGTMADFTAFDFGRLGEASDHPTATLGAFFSSDPETAAHWAWDPENGAHIMPVHLVITRPLELDGEAFRALASDASYRELRPQVEALRERMRAGGHDGIHVRAIPGASGEDIEFAGDIWIATSPEQIKSVYNLGTFDARNPDIRFARGQSVQLAPDPKQMVADLGDKHSVAAVRPGVAARKEGALRDRNAAFAAWLGAGNVLREQNGTPMVLYHGSLGPLGPVTGEVFWVTPYRELAATLNGRRRTVSALHVTVARAFDPHDSTHVDAIAEAMDRRWRNTSFDDWRRRLDHWKLWDDRSAREIVRGAGFDAIWSDEDGVPTLALIGPLADRVWRLPARVRHAAAPKPEQHGAARRGSEAFDAWSAESKIAYPSGEPMVLYHGTKSDFCAYDIKTFGASDDGLLGPGFYFTYNPEEASSYALNEQYGKGDAPNVQPVYVSLRDPFVIREGRLPDGRTIPDLHKGIGVTASGGRAVRQLAEAGGHDGIVWANRDGKILHVVAWRPEQIKSAIGNAGTYDPDDADIRFARDATKRLPPETHNLAFNHKLAFSHNVAVLPRRRADRDSYEP